MHNDVKEFRTHLAGRELTFRVGKLAGQADGAVEVRHGGTVILGTAVMANPRPGLDFMPLLVEYEEKFYAAGKIKGSRFIKREGRPSDQAIIAGRLTDRSIRPLFPKRMRDDVQVVTTVLSYDNENEPDALALLAASAALAISRIPWNGPLGAVRVARLNGEFVVSPTSIQLETADLDLMVAASPHEVVMLEASAHEASEADLLRAIDLGTESARTLAVFIADIMRQVGHPKASPQLFEFPQDLVTRVHADARKRMEEVLAGGDSKLPINDQIDTLTAELVQRLGDTPERAVAVKALCQQLYREIVRERILTEGRRVGDRRPEDVRPLRAEVGVLPRTHGSALFERGETQILSVTTLGAPDDTLILDTMTEDTKKRFFHFYNMPAFSVGEVKPNRGPSRRDIGHGNLAEHAVTALMPRKEQFPYTVMVVSEVLSSNGSSSMGSACAASLALMDAGVPFPRHVGGIAMGLVTDEHGRGRKPVILTDIAGMEDEGGDMDFKVAGTRAGITALQVDIKIAGLSPELIAGALDGAKVARLRVLDVMESALPKAREELSPYAPRIVILTVKPERIRDIIGPRGVTINKISEQTGVEITVEDDGTVFITSTSATGMEQATTWVKNLTREVTAGEEFDGKVVRLMNFGAFVELFPGTDGLVHISEFGPGFVRSIEDVTHVGDTLQVVVKEIDAQGRVNLSLRRTGTGMGLSVPPASAEGGDRPLRSPRFGSGDRRGPGLNHPPTRDRVPRGNPGQSGHGRGNRRSNRR